MAAPELLTPPRQVLTENDCSYTATKQLLTGDCNGYHLFINERDIGISDPNSIPITARSVSMYTCDNFIPPDFEERYKGLQIVEVGAGLAEFSPYMAHIATKKPIVIDPADYRTIRNLLVTAKQYDMPAMQIPTVDMLVHRIDTLLDPTKIRLYNMSLLDAVSAHPQELKGVADIVLDVFGAVQYPRPWAAKSQIDEIEGHFLSKAWWKGLV